MESVKIINKLPIRKIYTWESKVPRPRVCLQWRVGEAAGMCSPVAGRGGGIQMLELEIEATVSHNLEEVAAVFQK